MKSEADDRADARPDTQGCGVTAGRRGIVYLAYMDDSGTNNKNHKYQVMTAVLIEANRKFVNLEFDMASCIEKLMPPEKLQTFDEFHASDIYGGFGIFKDVEQSQRFAAINYLLGLVPSQKIPVIYGAVDRAQLATKVYGSADPLDICFRICAKGIQNWIGKNAGMELVLIIADDSDQKVRSTLRQSFRSMRRKISPPNWEIPELVNFPDDMYFGDSRDSLGIQLADLCSYFIAKHLEGNDPGGDGFFNVIENQIVYKKIEPEEQP